MPNLLNNIFDNGDGSDGGDRGALGTLGKALGGLLPGKSDSTPGGAGGGLFGDLTSKGGATVTGDAPPEGGAAAGAAAGAEGKAAQAGEAPKPKPTFFPSAPKPAPAPPPVASPPTIDQFSTSSKASSIPWDTIGIVGGVSLIVLGGAGLIREAMKKGEKSIPPTRRSP